MGRPRGSRLRRSPRGRGVGAGGALRLLVVMVVGRAMATGPCAAHQLITPSRDALLSEQSCGQVELGGTLT